MSEEMKGTTRYLDATVMEYALLDHARLRTPYGTQDDVRAYAAGDEDGCYWTGCMWDEDDYPDRLETPGMEESARPGGKTI